MDGKSRNSFVAKIVSHRTIALHTQRLRNHGERWAGAQSEARCRLEQRRPGPV
jgi:hypothetical protein